MQALHVLTQPDAIGAQLLLERHIIHNLVGLVSPAYTAAITAWPPWSAGGLPGVQSLLSLVASVLHMPFLQPGATEAFLKEIQEVSQLACFYMRVCALTALVATM